MSSTRARLVTGALALALLPTTASASVATRGADVPPHPPSPLTGLPRGVPHGQVVRLADGDRYEVTRSQGGRQIQGRRYDVQTGSWGARTTVFREADLRCWNVVARGAGSGIAVTFECGPALVEPDEGKPYAAATSDGVHWDARRLPGYAWRDPAISPAGTWAAWSRGQDYVTWTAVGGFVQHRASRSTGQFEDAQAPVVTDDGTVTIAWSSSAECTVTFDAYPAAGGSTSQVVQDARVCDDFATSVDASTVLLGDTDDRWSVTRLTRPDESSPWAVSRVAPLDASGLLTDAFVPDFAPTLLDAPGRPLAVIANLGDDLGVQLYDPASESWRAPVPFLSRAGGTRCVYEDDATARVGFYALTLRCRGGDRRLVTSPDGAAWQALPLRAGLVGLDARADLVAVPGRRRIVVLSRNGAATVPVGVTGRCDVVHPIGRRSVLRVTATRGSAGWPALLQRSTSDGWRTLRRLDLPHQGTCRRVFSGGLSGADFQLSGGGRTLGLRFVRRDGRWDVRRDY
ncbi:hypothetical protein EUA93_05920 [Nocardioides oleivorans]|uniref:Exo-alpha-sialidase n=1 Tax=Nocardioides oleivorans TaxID=273676 RepID=A0A4Q2S1L3_9ACTN|nr:hypothetical protein [Nocardioides oleivorans]RYB93933.1 hypothetical protein EUA93_05920 [Nocardioides oleivorans]